MTPSVIAHPWSKDTLFAKALLYTQRMEACSPEDSQFGIWSSLALELLARAALSHISPILLADAENWRHLMFALGHAPTAKKYFAVSISTKEVVTRLLELVPSFNAEIAGFCGEHISKRNAELHTGELVFASLGTSEWLPRFYRACKVLLESMDKKLEELVGDPASAESLVVSLEDKAAEAVKSDINAYANVWSKKGKVVRDQAVAQALAWATRQIGHRVTCPACQSAAIVQGNAIGTVTTSLEDGEVTQRQKTLPMSFECIACGLRISGLSRLRAAGFGNVFTATSTYSAAEYFELYTEDDLDEARSEARRPYEFEPDFNENE